MSSSQQETTPTRSNQTPVTSKSPINNKDTKDDASATSPRPPAAAPASAPAPAPAPAPEDANDGGEAQMLVSEFPPPPYYWRSLETLKFQPPPIPTECFEKASRKIRVMAQAAEMEMEKIRLEATSAAEGSSTNANQHAAEEGQQTSTAEATLAELSSEDKALLEDDEGMVAVFGEIVEDPLKVHVAEDCSDPQKVRDRLSKLNKDVLEGFVQLANDLVYNPLHNKKCRDELSHNLFLMIQEANKFREHQARELLLERLEKQLETRKKAVERLKKEVAVADGVLQRLEGLGLGIGDGVEKPGEEKKEDEEMGDSEEAQGDVEVGAEVGSEVGGEEKAKAENPPQAMEVEGS